MLWAVWSDGIYLTAWPRLAIFLVFAMFALGFAEGLTHWSFRTIVGSNGFAGNLLAPMASADGYGGPTRVVFAENLALMLVAIGVGTLSANLGLVLVLGYALGDIIHGPIAPGPGWRNLDSSYAWIYRHVPLLVSYILFFFIASLAIVMAKELARSAHPRMRRSTALSVGLTTAIHGLLVYSWGCMAPMVFRTVMLWNGGVPRMTVPYYREVTLTWFVPAAIAGVLVRAMLVGAGAENGRVLQRTQAALRQSLPIEQCIPAWTRTILGAAVTVLLLSGFLHTPTNYQPDFTTFAEAELIFGVLAIVLLTTAYLLPRLSAWRRWTATIEQYPAVLRLTAAVVISYVLCRTIIAVPNMQSVQGGEFGPEVTGILVGIALMLFLLPNGWLGLRQSVHLLPRAHLGRPSLVTKLVLLAFFVPFVSRRALADCWDYACCFASLPGAAAAAVAGAIPWLGGSASTAGSNAQGTGDGSGPNDSKSGGKGNGSDNGKEPWWKPWAKWAGADKIDFAGGMWASTEKPQVGIGHDWDLGENGSIGAEGSVEVADGHDPSGPILNVDVKVSATYDGIGGSISDHATVGIDTSRPGLDGLSTSTHDQMSGIDLP